MFSFVGDVFTFRVIGVIPAHRMSSLGAPTLWGDLSVLLRMDPARWDTQRAPVQML